MQKTLNKILIGLFLFVGVFLFGQKANATETVGSLNGYAPNDFNNFIAQSFYTADALTIHNAMFNIGVVYDSGRYPAYIQFLIWEVSSLTSTTAGTLKYNMMIGESNSACPDYRTATQYLGMSDVALSSATQEVVLTPPSGTTVNLEANHYYRFEVMIWAGTTSNTCTGNNWGADQRYLYDSSDIIAGIRQFGDPNNNFSAQTGDLIYALNYTPTPDDGIIDFTSPLVDFPTSPQTVNFAGTYTDLSTGYDSIIIYSVDSNDNGFIYGNIYDIPAPDCSAGVCNFSVNEIFYGGNYSYHAKMIKAGEYGADNTNANWTFMIPDDGEIVIGSSITIYTPLENDNLPVGDILFKGEVINGDSWLVAYPTYDTLLLRIYNKDNSEVITDTLALPPTDSNTSFSFSKNLISGNYAYSLWAYDPDENILNAGLSLGSINFTIGHIDVGGGTLPTDYCDWDFSIFGYNTALLSTVCKMIVPAPNSISAIFQNYITDLKNTFPAVVEFYSTMNNGFDSLSSSSTATPSFADVEMPVGGNDTVAVQFIDFSQISGYMATFRGWMSIFIWFSVIWLCYERVIGLFNPNFKPTPPMSNNTINLSKGERIN